MMILQILVCWRLTVVRSCSTQKHAVVSNPVLTVMAEEGEKLNTKAIARYPVYNSETKEIITLQKRISQLPVNYIQTSHWRRIILI